MQRRILYTALFFTFLLSVPLVRCQCRSPATYPLKNKEKLCLKRPPRTCSQIIICTPKGEWKCATCNVGEEEACYTGPEVTRNKGLCKDGTRTCHCLDDPAICNNTDWSDCNGQVLPAPKDQCDGLDNNCNGQIDEGCPCTPGETRKCGQSEGTCKEGIQHCQNGKWSSVCEGETPPSPEICDNKDNNCDGKTDEDLTRPCSNGCGSGQETCQSGQWVNCTAPPPVTEICNNKDDDCDGKIDYPIPQAPNCTSQLGLCQGQKQICVGGAWRDCAVSGYEPSTEKTCNDGKDNDCDGKIDGADPDCGVCNNGATRPCYTGPNGTEGIGLCHKGKETCTNGQWSGICNGEVTPQKEVCNNSIDDDCDNQTDDADADCAVCQPKETQPCYTGPSGTEGIGPCKGGIQTCQGGQWSSTCQGEVLPTQEDCNNSIDDDCDGKTDGNDSDCASCTNNDKRPCYTGPSGTENNPPCKKGTQTCRGGQWQTCQGEVLPTQEVCSNGIDEDCNGTADDTPACSITCQPGATDACYSGPTGTRNTGECKDGQKVCDSNGNWEPCKGDTTPSKELCKDGKDNDCDGQTDEGCKEICENCSQSSDCAPRGSLKPACVKFFKSTSQKEKVCLYLGCTKNDQCPRGFYCNTFSGGTRACTPKFATMTKPRWTCENYRNMKNKKSCSCKNSDDTCSTCGWGQSSVGGARCKDKKCSVLCYNDNECPSFASDCDHYRCKP